MVPSHTPKLSYRIMQDDHLDSISENYHPEKEGGEKRRVKKTYQPLLLLHFISFMNYKGRCHYILLILCCCFGSGCRRGELRMSAAV